MKIDEIPGRRPGHREASATITAALGTARFPASKDALVKDVGTWKVPLGGGETTTLGKILDAIPEEQFASFQDAQNRVDQHWDRVIQGLQGAKAHARGGKGSAAGRKAPEE